MDGENRFKMISCQLRIRKIKIPIFFSGVWFYKSCMRIFSAMRSKENNALSTPGDAGGRAWRTPVLLRRICLTGHGAHDMLHSCNRSMGYIYTWICCSYMCKYFVNIDLIFCLLSTEKTQSHKITNRWHFWRREISVAYRYLILFNLILYWSHTNNK